MDDTASRSFQSVSPSSWSVLMKQAPLRSVVLRKIMSAGTRWSWEGQGEERTVSTNTFWDGSKSVLIKISSNTKKYHSGTTVGCSPCFDRADCWVLVPTYKEWLSLWT